MKKTIKSIYKNILSERTRINIRLFTYKLIHPLYIGNNFYCNCCKKSFRKFLDYGNIQRENARCPYCLSLERTRILDYYLETEVELYKKSNLKLLHFAPENCLFKKISMLNIEYIDADINPSFARYVIDITNIPYEANYFDIIICSHVLGHVPNEEKAISEMLRVLKSDGIAIVMTIIDKTRNTFENKNFTSDEDRLKNYGEFDLVRLHGIDFNKRLEKQGFKVDCIDYKDKLSNELVKKSSLGDGSREIIYLCKK